MKIFSAAQIREWDQYSIANEPISSVDLMERAASTCAKWIENHFPSNKRLLIFCGSGNNGGDGLAIARMLAGHQRIIDVYILQGSSVSTDCQTNLQRLQQTNIDVSIIANTDSFPEIADDDLVIDALYGTGLNKPLAGPAQMLVQYINQCEATVISIDVPSGLYADICSAGNSVIKADYTLSFQVNKLAFMLNENGAYTGKVNILDIGLDEKYYQNTDTDFYTVDIQLASSLLKPREKFSHKYSFGHALLYCGSTNMMGAAVLASKSCLRSGAGLVTVHVPGDCMPIIQTAVPEAICSSENDKDSLWKKKSVIGIGPGLSIDNKNSLLLKDILTNWKGPLVIDASGLHLLKPCINDLSNRTASAVLTPHAGEFEMLFGKCNNDFERMRTALQKAAQHNCYIVLKGHHTMIASPNGDGYFNTTGNSGMATAGSGDVLTGIISGLLSQGYTPENACILGVYLHGLAGDLAAAAFSEEAMIAGDITEKLGEAFRRLRK